MFFIELKNLLKRIKTPSLIKLIKIINGWVWSWFTKWILRIYVYYEFLSFEKVCALIDFCPSFIPDIFISRFFCENDKISRFFCANENNDFPYKNKNSWNNELSSQVLRKNKRGCKGNNFHNIFGHLYSCARKKIEGSKQTKTCMRI